MFAPFTTLPRVFPPIHQEEFKPLTKWWKGLLDKCCSLNCPACSRPTGGVQAADQVVEGGSGRGRG